MIYVNHLTKFAHGFQFANSNKVQKAVIICITSDLY